MLGLEIHGIYIEDVLDGFDPDESLVLSRYPHATYKTLCSNMLLDVRGQRLEYLVKSLSESYTLVSYGR